MNDIMHRYYGSKAEPENASELATQSDKWLYMIENDHLDQAVGAIFRKANSSKVYAVTFFDNEPACIDWLNLPHDEFFHKWQYKVPPTKRDVKMFLDGCKFMIDQAATKKRGRESSMVNHMASHYSELALRFNRDCENGVLS